MESILLTIADFVNQSADFARKLVTSKEHATPGSERKGNATSQTYNLSFSSDDPANGSESEMPGEYSMYHVRS